MTRNPMLRKLRVILTILVLGATGFVIYRFGPGATRAGTPTVADASPLWVVSDLVRLKGDTPPAERSAVWDGSTIKLFGMRNEVIAWQVALLPATPVISLGVTLEPLISDSGQVIRTEQATVFREHFLELAVPSQYDSETPVPDRMGPGLYPCQLLPLTAGQTLDAPGRRLSALWFDLHIPPDAAPGVYRGKLTLDGGAVNANWGLEVEVLPLAMPAETHFTNWFYYGPEHLTEFYGDALLRPMEQRFQQLAHDHRITLATEPTVADGGFGWGGWWANYGGYLTGEAFETGPGAGAGTTCWPVRLEPEASDADFAAAAKSVVAFFSGKGLLDKILYPVWDEPDDAAAYEEIRRVGKRVDAAVGDQLPVFVTEQIQPQEPGFGTLLGAVDIFCSADSSDADIAAARNRGADVWVYNGGFGGAPLIDIPLTGMAAWGPAAWRFKLGGWYYWDALYWRQKHFDIETPTDLYADPLTFDETRRTREDGTPYPADWALRLNGDGVFFYPGEPVGVDGPVTCLRAKGFRRGAQDYEYLWLLAKQGKQAAADAFAARLSLGRKQYEQNPDTWLQVRREMAAALTGAEP